MTKSICIVSGADLSVPSPGAEKPVIFAKELQKNGFDVKLVVPKSSAKSLYDLSGIEVYTVPIKIGTTSGSYLINQIGRAILLTRRAKKIKDKENVILQFEHATLGGFAAFMGLSDFVLDVRDISFDFPLYTKIPGISRIVYYLEGLATRRAIKSIVVSNPMKDFIIEKWGISEEQIEVIPNGYFEKELEKCKGIEEVDGTISFLGALIPKLDINKFIAIAESLKNRDITIYMIGDGPARSPLEQKIREKGLKNVVFTGWLPPEEAYKLVAKTQITLLPLTRSLHNEVSCPVKIYAYASLGKAIVADNISEIVKIFKENDAALVSDQSDQNKFVENVHTLLDDETLRKRISTNAKKLVEDFTWEKQGERLARMYEGLI